MVTTYLESKLILLSNMVGFGSDGASVMIGRHNGVAARLKCHQPILTSIHCIAHRLALAAGQSGDSVPYIANTFKPTLRQLFYFYEKSPVRMSGLKAIEQLLQTPQLKLNQPADTRWFSHDTACQTLMRVLPAVIASLEKGGSGERPRFSHWSLQGCQAVYFYFNLVHDVWCSSTSLSA